MKKRVISWAAVPTLLLVLWGMAFVACAADKTESSGAGKTSAAVEIAAEVGGEKITFEELDEHLRKTNARAFQEYYQAQRAALENLIGERLMAAEAASRGVSEEQLHQEITGAVPAVTDADIETWYNQNKARMGNRTLDQVRDQARNYLTGMRTQQAVASFLDGLREKAGVQVYLEPPRVEVKIAASDPFRGPESAPVVIVEYSDFQ